MHLQNELFLPRKIQRLNCRIQARAAHQKSPCRFAVFNRTVYQADQPFKRSAAAKPEQLKDPDFFKLNTLITLYTVAGAVSALANNDPISKESARYTVDGEVSLGIKGGASVTILVKDHRFTTLKQPAENPRAVMEFASLELAHGLFAGEVSTVNEMCKGNIRLAGVLSMVDNINRILDRVSLYLE